MLASEMSLQPIFNHIRTQSENIELKRYGRPKNIIKNKKKSRVLFNEVCSKLSKNVAILL